MEPKRGIRLFTAWFKARLKVTLLCLLLMGTYCLVGTLKQVDREVLTYSTSLCSFFLLVVGGMDYLSYTRRYGALWSTYVNRAFTLDYMPEAKDALEAMHHYMIETLSGEIQEEKRKKAMQLSEMGDYYTLWAHQIKTPIAAMHLLLKDEEVEKRLIEEELFKIEQYVEMVLHYLRLESLSADLVLKPYSLYDVVKQAVKKYAMSFIYKKITLNLEPFALQVITDEKWLLFVIEQLLSNSLKYTKTGSITITARDGAHKQLIIKDTGIGIREEDLPRIFDRGFTGYNGRMDKRSTGIGLYLCKEVMTKLTHQIAVSSQIGEGTTVTINFLEEPNLTELSHWHPKM